jgi:hypothetical protein
MPVQASGWKLQVLENASTGVGVENAGTGKCRYWKMKVLENAGTGKCRYWKMQVLENEGTGKCRYWKMQVLENVLLESNSLVQFAVNDGAG